MSKAQIRNIWGVAKKGLNMSDEDLYSILQRETGKDSMRECTTLELNRVLLALRSIKEQSGNRATEKQVWKIRQLEKQLKWDDNSKRLAAFLKKYYGVERPEWLTKGQAWKVIESLKKVASR